ncbi:MAG: hypothetical protein ABSG76_20575 [Xanthobacteraceae bacterium]
MATSCVSRIRPSRGDRGRTIGHSTAKKLSDSDELWFLLERRFHRAAEFRIGIVQVDAQRPSAASDI